MAFLLAACILSVPEQAYGRDVVVWFEDELPSEEAQRIVERGVGTVDHIIEEGIAPQVKQQVIEGATTGFSDDLKRTLLNHGLRRDGAVFVAAMNGEYPVVLPYAFGAVVTKQGLVTLGYHSEVGGRYIDSPLFDAGVTNTVALDLGIGLEFGVGYLALAGGAGVVATPGATRTYSNEDMTQNLTVEIFPRAWAGAGLYLLRPSKQRGPTLRALATIGFDAPAHQVVGGEVSWGIPTRKEASWIRITAGASGASHSLWDEVLQRELVPMVSGYISVGLGKML